MTDSRLTGLPVAATATRVVGASNPAADGTRDARVAFLLRVKKARREAG